jgi:hypothetical protein
MGRATGEAMNQYAVIIYLLDRKARATIFMGRASSKPLTGTGITITVQAGNKIIGIHTHTPTLRVIVRLSILFIAAASPVVS